MGRLIKIIVIVLVCNMANETNVINVGRRQTCYFDCDVLFALYAIFCKSRGVVVGRTWKTLLHSNS